MTSNLDYKKYSLDKLKEWVHDALSCGEASPHEIYSAIREAVQEDYQYYKEHSARAFGLLELMSGHRPVSDKSVISCDKDDKSPECQKAWNDFWEENYYPEEYKKSTKNVNLDKEIEEVRKQGGYDWTPEPAKSYSDKFKSQNGVTYNEYTKAKIEAGSAWNDGWTQQHYQKIVDKYEGKQPKKWVLPVEPDPSGEYFVTFPDDLLEVANLKENDMIEWVDQGDGSYLLKKCTERYRF